MEISQTKKQKEIIYKLAEEGRCHYSRTVNGITVLEDSDGYGRGCTIIFSCLYIVDRQEKILSLETRYSEGESMEVLAHLIEIGASGEFSTLSRELDGFGNRLDDKNSIKDLMCL